MIYLFFGLFIGGALAVIACMNWVITNPGFKGKLNYYGKFINFEIHPKSDETDDKIKK